MKSKDQQLLEEAYRKILIKEDPDECMIGQFVEVPFGVVSFDPILSATKHPEHPSRD